MTHGSSHCGDGLSSRVALLVVALLALFGTDPAFSAGKASLSDLVLQSQLLSRGVLVNLREIQTTFPTDVATPAANEAARRQLGSTKALVQAFDEHQESARQVAKQILKSSDQSRFHQQARTAVSQLDRHRVLVRKFFARAVDRYGSPIEAGPSSAARSGNGRAAGASESQVRIRGTLQGGLGSSGYKQQGTVSGIDESANLFEGSVSAQARLHTGTALVASLSRETKVIRQETTVTNARLGVVQSLAPGIEAEGSFGFRGYDSGFAKETGFGETNLQAVARLDRAGRKFEAGIEKRGRSYSEDDPRQQNFDVSKLHSSFELSTGTGRLSAAVTKVHREGESPGQEFDIFHPRISWTGNGTGSEIRGSLERFEAPNDDSRNNNRIKAHAYLGRTSSAGRSRYGLEFQKLEFPDLPEGAERGYMDAGFGGRSASIKKDGARGTRTRQRWRAYYRKHEEETNFDFVNASFSRRSRPTGSGFGTELGITAKVFVESGETDELSDIGPNPTDVQILSAIGDIVQAFQDPRAPHTVDFLARLQWKVSTSTTWLPMVEISPSVGHLMFIDTERSRLQEDAEDLAKQLSGVAINQPLGDGDFLYKNSINRARAGARIAARFAPTPESSLEAAVQYDTDVLYNADPVQTLKTIDIDITGNVPLRPDLRLEGRLNIHRSRVGEDTGRDFNRHEALLRIHYLFDVEVSP